MSNASASGARATATRSLPARGDVTLDPRGPYENIPTAVQTMAITVMATSTLERREAG